jgi:hypothetical protein
MSACIKSMAAEPTANMMRFFFVQWMSQNAAESAMPKSATATPFGTVRAFTT